MKVIPTVITGRVELNDVEKECVKEYITRYHSDSKYDTLQEYLYFIDTAESFELRKVHSKGKYVDGIEILGREYSRGCHYTSLMTLDEIRRRYLNKGYFNGKRYEIT